MDIIHKKGALYVVPDALSRAPLEVCELYHEQTEEEDSWYREMLKNVLQKPEKYPDWMERDGVLYRYPILTG